MISYNKFSIVNFAFLSSNMTERLYEWLIDCVIDGSINLDWLIDKNSAEHDKVI